MQSWGAWVWMDGVGGAVRVVGAIEKKGIYCQPPLESHHRLDCE